MTVGELIEELKKHPSDMPVVGHSIGFGNSDDTWYNFRPDLMKVIRVLWDKDKPAMHEWASPRATKNVKKVLEIR